ncbi:CBS domain-containing protein [Halorubellus sp. PRR65]|uniref:CBS domain-containing protein n=1 Tax=Halorubellus sp. PRR65 TaxID=3098148 RepID=UPI002B25CACB|nr:CBS domain-containing protein [Halorubellus sp. PRR65]
MVLIPVREIDAPAFKTVPADTTIRDAVDEMLSKNFSQLGLTKDGELIGAVSYRSICRTVLVAEELYDDPRKLSDRAVETAVERPRTVHEDDSLTDLFSILGERSYVLVEEQEGSTRIITDYDLREFWRQATEPFLLIEETELAIRGIIRSEFDGELSKALRTMTEGAEHLETVDAIEDCSFGHYVQFTSEHWEDGFEDFFDQRPDFVRNLINRLGENRNRLFHFRIDNREELDLDVIHFAHGYFTSLHRNQ